MNTALLIESTQAGRVGIATNREVWTASGARGAFTQCGSDLLNPTDIGFDPSGTGLVVQANADGTSEIGRCGGQSQDPLDDFEVVAVAASYPPDEDLEEAWGDACDEDPNLCVQSVDTVVAVGTVPGTNDGKLIYFPDGNLDNPVVYELPGFEPHTVTMYGQTQYAFVAGLSGSSLVVRLYDVVTETPADRYVAELTMQEGGVARRILYCCQNIHVLADK